jgi:curved DNA-binding protein CbpA
MPKIYLKPNSAEFADGPTDNNNADQCCDMPGCPDHGEYKAPRHRGLNEFYYFCLAHIQEYNKKWDYFSGMNQSEVEDHITRSALWDRPTRRYDNFANLEENLKRRAWQTYHFSEKEPPKEEEPQKKSYQSSFQKYSPEGEALDILGLVPPLDLPKLKARYKELVKQHHPDINPGNKDAEEMLKRINMAYTILKNAYEQYEKLPTR